MPRVKRKKLRGSVRQNNAQEEEEESWLRFFGFWPRLAFLVLGCVALIILTGWFWHGDWPREKRQEIKKASLELSKDIGFAVQDVMVEGRRYTDKQDIIKALGIKAGQPIYGFNPHQAYEDIMKLPWVRSTSILRSLPNKIIIRLQERTPVARWRHKERTLVIDSEGQPISAAKDNQFPSLPLIIGDIKPEQTEKLIAILDEFPSIAQRLKAAVRISGRRWDLHLHPNITVRLPQEDERYAMLRLEELMKQQKIEQRGVKTIDLRLREKVFIEPISPPTDDEEQHP
ncbi:MAG: cell division protein FtsQ/DivIB [Bdellovibrionales bacterium]